MSKNIITASAEDKDERLDHFLVKALPGLSRSKIQKMIKDGLVKVNGKPATVHRFLKTNDEIIVADEDEVEAAAKQKSGSIKKLKAGVKQNDRSLWEAIKLIDDTPEYLVIEKPSGLLVHPTDKGETNTLIDWVISKYPALRNIGEDPRRAAIVHRLDKEVSGLMVIPKTQDAFVYFKRLFKLRQIEKRYLALVYGEVKSDTGEINFPIGRSKDSEGLFAATPVESGLGKPAKTIFWIKKRFKNFTLLEVEIMTGRTHQIRVHLKALGHPIVGDELYKIRGLRKKMEASRIFLHAASLSFTDMKGHEKKYEAKIPDALKEILERAK